LPTEQITAEERTRRSSSGGKKKGGAEMSDVAQVSQGVQKVAEEVAKTETSVKPQEPSSDDVACFEKSLAADTQQGASLPAEPAAAIQGTQAAGDSKTVGDAILQGLEKMRETQDARIQNIEQTLDAAGDKPMNIQDSMKLQYDLMQMNLEQELTSKTADKTTQGVQTLFKNQ
jgi:type III secretion system YscI/HrpB-like protein